VKKLNHPEFYVYLHRRKTDSSVFYVGKGSRGRATSRSGRNRWWRRIEEKHGFYHEILYSGLSNEDACKLEIETIAKLKASGTDLCNVALGGESGLVGIPLSEEHKEILRQRKIGKKQSPEHARKSAQAKLGKKQPREAVEALISKKRKPVINSNGDVFASASHAAKAMSELFGGYASQGNVSMAARGERLEAYGLAWSYDTSKKPSSPSLIKPNMKQIICSNGMRFNSTQDATRWVKSWRGSASNQCITACARNEKCSAYGFFWSYL
jgi:hypothetical protein